MPVTIKNLRTTVRVKVNRRESSLHAPPQPERPSMEFAMPITEQVLQGDPNPGKTATQGKGAASGRGPVSAKNADPKKVADRVYELMKREIILGKMRGGMN
ncbi:MAG: hypothetical protein ACHQ50_02730 [Fimbriimonadales bacterium]